MKYVISLFISVLVFSSCSTKYTTHKKADTSIIVAIFNNPYQGGLGLDSCFRIIKDSVHVGEEKNTVLPDTIYFIRVTFPIYDRKDSTHKRMLKTVAGVDSIITSFMPCPADQIMFDFSNPTRAFKPVRYPYSPSSPKH